MTNKIINVLRPISKTDPGYGSFVSAYYEEPTLFNMNNFLAASNTTVSVKEHMLEEPSIRDVVLLEFVAAGFFRSYHVTPAEFHRVFGHDMPNGTMTPVYFGDENSVKR